MANAKPVISKTQLSNMEIVKAVINKTNEKMMAAAQAGEWSVYASIVVAGVGEAPRLDSFLLAGTDKATALAAQAKFLQGVAELDKA